MRRYALREAVPPVFARRYDATFMLSRLRLFAVHCRLTMPMFDAFFAGR